MHRHLYSYQLVLVVALLLGFLSVPGTCVRAQNTPLGTVATQFSGVVTDATSGEPIAYASVGIVGQPIGVIAASDGTFSLKTDGGLQKGAQLKISAIGYQPAMHTVGEAWSPNVQLAASAHELTTVEVSSLTFGDVERVGKHKTPDRVTFYFQSNQLGTELGMQLKSSPAERLVKTLNFYILENALDSVAFRVHLYEYQPDSAVIMQELLPENYIIRTDIKSGWLHVDVADAEVIIPPHADVVMALEWLDDYGSGTAKVDDLQFGASLSRKGAIHVKQATQDNWSFFRKRYYGMQTKLAFYAEVAPAVASRKK